MQHAAAPSHYDLPNIARPRLRRRLRNHLAIWQNRRDCCLSQRTTAFRQVQRHHVVDRFACLHGRALSDNNAVSVHLLQQRDAQDSSKENWLTEPLSANLEHEIHQWEITSKQCYKECYTNPKNCISYRRRKTTKPASCRLVPEGLALHSVCRQMSQPPSARLQSAFSSHYLTDPMRRCLYTTETSASDSSRSSRASPVSSAHSPPIWSASTDPCRPRYHSAYSLF